MNLATTNKNDFTVNQDGGAFISQRKVAELCGTDQSAISLRCSSLNFAVKQGISDENAILLITFYAIESKAANDTARRSLAMVAKAGMRAYIYTEAGYKLTATQAANDPVKLEPLAYIDKLLLAQKMICDDLRLPDSGRLQLYGTFNQKHGSHLALPAYSVDDGLSSSGSSRVTKSASELLKENGSKLSTMKFNVLAIGLGFMETKTRPSSTRGTKEFKSITEKGIKFGKNLTSPNNPRETQPHWYVDTFSELLNLIGNI